MHNGQTPGTPERDARLQKYLADEASARERLATFPDAVRQRLIDWQEGQSEWFSDTLLEIVAEFIAFDDAALTPSALSGDAGEVPDWIYDIQWGPEGQQDYAHVFDRGGNIIAVMKTHDAALVAKHRGALPSHKGAGEP